MAKREPSEVRNAPSEEHPETIEEQRRLKEMTERDEELVGDKDIFDACLAVYKDVEKGFADQWDRANDAMDYWDIYNCQLGPKQFYSGNSKVFVPIVPDAVDARKVRFTNQIFPVSGKNVEVISSESKPQDLMSLLEFYIRKCHLRNEIIPALMVSGDVEGQYNVYMRWAQNERHVTWKIKKEGMEHEGDEDQGYAPLQVQGEKDLQEFDSRSIENNEDISTVDDDYYDIEEDTVVHQFPVVEVLADADVLVLPFSAANVESAIAAGGSATILRKWSKSKIEQLIDEGEIDEAEGKKLLKEFEAVKKDTPGPNADKKMIDAAGVRWEGEKQAAHVYETWTMLNVDGERRMCRIYFGSEEIILGVKRNPYWCDLCPLLSSASRRVRGSFKGQSRVKRVETMQYAANDFFNEGMDSAHFSLCPIVLTDPLKNPRTTTMVLSTSAIWETSPNDTQFAKFPALWQDAFGIVEKIASFIFQDLGVNPAMIPQMPAGAGSSKTNQAKVAQEQQVDILTTADVVTELESGILTPILRWFVYLDHQFRDDDLMVRQFGVEGRRMSMDAIKPVQFDRRFEVKWFGVESARSAQQMQLQMAGLNVVRGIPPQLYQGFKLNLVPVIQQFLENLYGPRVAAEVFQDMRRQLTLDVEFENRLLHDGFDVPVQALDDDAAHLRAHMAVLQETKDPTGFVRKHMMLHQQQMQQKSQQQQMQQIMQQMQGQGQQGPGQKRLGSAGGQSRGGQGPAGMIHSDQLGGTQAPRQRQGVGG